MGLQKLGETPGRGTRGNIPEAREGISPGGDDDIIDEMSRRHPGFTRESLIDVWYTGLMPVR